MSSWNKTKRFEVTVLVHLNAAYNLAGWLTRHGPDAEDIVQEACLKAFKYFDSFHGTEAKSWFLAIVRNACYSRFQQNKQQISSIPLDKDEDEDAQQYADTADGPEQYLSKLQDARLLDAAIALLPIEFREVLILRELEDMSYKAIADIAQVPLGTVMSRLARARNLLRQYLSNKGLES